MNALPHAPPPAGWARLRGRLAATLRGKPLLWLALRFGLAAACVAAALVLQNALSDWVGAKLPTFILFYPTVVVVALLGGWGPGLLATALTLVAVDYWLLPSVGQFSIASPVDQLALALFAFNGSLITAVTELYRRSRREAADYERDAQVARTLRESEERLATVVDNLTEGVVIGDSKGNVFHWNPAALVMHGYASMDECRRRLPEFIDTFELGSLDGTRTAFDDWPMPRIMRDETLRDCQLRLRRLDQGWEKIVSYSGSMVQSAGGEMLVFLSITDITERNQAEAERQKFVSLADRSTEFIGMCGLDFKPFYVNEAGRRLVGLDSLEDACAVRVQDYFFPEDQAMITEEFFPRVLREGRGEVEVRFRHFKTGEALWMIYNVFQVKDATGRVAGYATVSRDITARKRAERARERTTALLEAIHRAQTQFIVAQDISSLFEECLDDLLTLMNSEYGFIDELFYAPDGKPYLLARGITDIAWNDESRKMYQQFFDGSLKFTNPNSLFGAVMTTGKPVIANDAPHDARGAGIPPGHPPLRTFLGLPLHTSSNEFVGVIGLANRPGGYSQEDVAYLEPLMLAYANLIAAKRNDQRRQESEEYLRKSEENLKASLHEKEVLLKEIHHRVKNNMQVISSLVSLQCDRLEGAAMRSILQDVSHRVRSMALVHEKLYQSHDMARVEFAEYAQSLLNYLWRAHGNVASGVRLVIDLKPAPLSINAAVPCGLILNELATNALKHAFPAREGARGERESGRGGEGETPGAPEVRVTLSTESNGRVCLRVRDNGVGLPPGLDWRKANSLGLRLVQILAAQLHANVDVDGEEGTEFRITF